MARRFRDLVESFARDLGGFGDLSESEQALVKQAASLTIRAEQLQSAIVRGEPVDADELIRLANTARRLVAQFPKRAQAGGAGHPTLAQYLAAQVVQPADESEPA